MDREYKQDKMLEGVTVSLLSRWWSLLSLLPGPPAGWCTCLQREPVAAAGLAPQTGSLRPPPAWHTPSLNGPAGIPLCPGTSSPLLGWWCSALHRTFLATDSSQGSEEQALFHIIIVSTLVINWINYTVPLLLHWFSGLGHVHVVLLFIKLQHDWIQAAGQMEKCPLWKKFRIWFLFIRNTVF